MAKVWVYLNTYIQYEGARLPDLESDLSDYHPTYNKKGELHTITVSRGTQEVMLEHVKSSSLFKRRPNWVYRGTGIRYCGSLPVDLNQNLINYQPTFKNNKLNTITFFKDGKEIILENIAKHTMSGRSPRWVYVGTGSKFTGPLPSDLNKNLVAYQPTYNKNGMLRTITVPLGDKEITLECLTKNALASRKLHWVYSKTGTEYSGPLPKDLEENLSDYNPKYKNGKLYTITITRDNKEFTLERVTSATLRHRYRYWVYYGTGEKYSGPLPEDLDQNMENYNPTYKRGKLRTITIERNNKKYTLEYVTRSMAGERKRRWVYRGTGIEYSGCLPEDLNQNLEAYQPTYKNGILSTITFFLDDNEVNLESITEGTLRNRYTHWLYPETGLEYLGSLPEDLNQKLEAYKPTYNKNHTLHTITFFLGDKEITLENVSHTLYTSRQPHWVYPGTGLEYSGSLPEDLNQNLETYKPTYNKTNMLHTITFLLGDREITLERVSYILLHGLQPHWFYPGTELEYSGPLPEDLHQNLAAYMPTYNEYNMLKSITFVLNSQEVTLERVAKRDLHKRKLNEAVPRTTDSEPSSSNTTTNESEIQNILKTQFELDDLFLSSNPDNDNQTTTSSQLPDEVYPATEYDDSEEHKDDINTILETEYNLEDILPRTEPLSCTRETTAILRKRPTSERDTSNSFVFFSRKSNHKESFQPSTKKPRLK